MNYKYRRRSGSRESFRRYSSDDRSDSRSRSPRRYKRSASRSKRSYSKNRRHFPKDDRSFSRSFSSEENYRDHKRHFSPSPQQNDFERKPPADFDGEIPRFHHKSRIRNMAWKLPNPNERGSRPANFPPFRNNNSRRNRFHSRFDTSFNKNSLYNYRYESEEFKSNKEKMTNIFKEKEMANKEKTKLLSEYTATLKNLVGNLSMLEKDSEEYKEHNEKIQSLKKEMKDLIQETAPKTRVTTKSVLQENAIDNRKTKIFFSKLPDCAQGKGNLAKWISDNSKILLPKEIAMLASQGNSHEAAVIQYRNHATARKVLNSCKLHGIAVSWLASEEPEAAKTEDQSKPTNGVPEVIDIGSPSVNSL